MPNYTVQWVIDIEADDPVKAAQEALKIQRDRVSTATVFQVIRNSDGKPYQIDLDNILICICKGFYADPNCKLHGHKE